MTHKYSNLSVYLQQRERDRRVTTYAWVILTVVVVAVVYYTMHTLDFEANINQEGGYESRR